MSYASIISLLSPNPKGVFWLAVKVFLEVLDRGGLKDRRVERALSKLLFREGAESRRILKAPECAQKFCHPEYQ